MSGLEAPPQHPPVAATRKPEQPHETEQGMARKMTVPLHLSASEVERFMSRVIQSDDPTACWSWAGSHRPNGYGVFNACGNARPAHRVAWVIRYGDIEDRTLVIDHLCRNRGCVNPDHLEPVTNAENLLRSELTIPGANARKSTCPKGHEYDAWYGGRKCSECGREVMRRYSARKRAAAAR